VASIRGRTSALARAVVLPIEVSLERLPVLEKAALRAAGDRMLLTPSAPLFRVNTSGSTGITLQLLRSQRDQAEIWTLWARVFAAYGRRTWDRQSISARDEQ
jgi:phenylacetate-coenzyme A ligase PaaK-like adenylate-forming protein